MFHYDHTGGRKIRHPKWEAISSTAELYKVSFAAIITARAWNETRRDRGCKEK